MEICAGGDLTVSGQIIHPNPPEGENYTISVFGNDGSFNSVTVPDNGQRLDINVTPNQVDGCDPKQVDYTIQITCSTGGGLVKYTGVLGTVTVFPELTAVIVTPPDCTGNPGSVEIRNANDNTVCGVTNAGIPGADGCPQTPSQINYNFDPFSQGQLVKLFLKLLKLL